jgi:uncharacterized protein (DUF433 family)
MGDAHRKGDAEDIREVATYGLAEAAQYLRIPLATVRSWVLGQYYPTRAGRTFFKPLIQIAGRDPRQLSFINLVELHILDAIRREHEIPMQKVRPALLYLKKDFPSNHPLAENRFETDGVRLFVEKSAQLIDLSQEGQLAMRQILGHYLKRIERDEGGLPIRLYPFTRKREPDEPRAVVIDPSLSFGRPVIAGTGVVTTIVAERYKAGESIEELAEDYAVSTLKIQEAIRCELPLEAA